RYESGGAQPDALLRGRELRPMHALPGRDGEGRHADGNRALGPGAVNGAVRRHARRLDLRAGPSGAQSAAMRAEVFPGGAGEAARELVMDMRPHTQGSSPRRRGPIITDGGYGSRRAPPPGLPPRGAPPGRPGPKPLPRSGKET